MDSHTNFAISTVATVPSPATSGTTCAVASGTGALFPAVPFNATVWPAGVNPTSANAEIVRVTALAGDDLTIVRAREGTSARTWLVNCQIAATVTAKTLTDAEYGAHAIVNVLDPAYGAVGDGVTDDTAAVQAAASAAAGKVLLIPRGYTFVVSDRIAIASAMVVRVDGTIQTTEYQYEVTPGAIFYVTADDVVIEGSGTLTGPGTFDHSTVADVLRIPSLVRVHGADNVIIRNLRFVDGPQACIVYNTAHHLTVTGCTFTGGDTVASCVADINYYGIHGYESDYSVIANNRFVDDASGNTFAEGIFIYGTDHSDISRNFFKNIVDHDVYLYHSVGDTSGVNNYNTVSGNVSYSTLTNGTQKVGASFKAHGTFNVISENHILNSNSGIVLEGGSYSTIAKNTIVGFSTQGIIITDLVATNASGLNYITVEGNTLYGAVANTSGIYYRGDATYTTANCVGSKILGNTIVRVGDGGGGSATPIDLYHSNASYYMDGFVVEGNVIINPRSVYGMYLDRVRFSKFTGNLVKDGTYTAWRGFQFQGNSSYNTLSGNIVRDDQGTPLLERGVNYGGVTVTDMIVRDNVFHSLYASRSANPWGVDATYRNVGDRNLHDDTLGYPVALSTAEATASITAAASVVISTAVPSGARLRGVQLRVDTALAGGDLWDAAYSGGATQSIATAQAVAKDTKVNAMFNTNAATDITSSATDVTITKNGGGSFTAQGAIRALVYYESLTALGNAP